MHFEIFQLKITAIVIYADDYCEIIMNVSMAIIILLSS